MKQILCVGFRAIPPSLIRAGPSRRDQPYQFQEPAGSPGVVSSNVNIYVIDAASQNFYASSTACSSSTKVLTMKFAAGWINTSTFPTSMTCYSSTFAALGSFALTGASQDALSDGRYMR